MKMRWLAIVALLSAIACSAPEAQEATSRRVVDKAVTETEPNAPVAKQPATEAPKTSVPRARTLNEQAWEPFASVGGVTLRHPSSRVEIVAYHESNHDGARQLEPIRSTVPQSTLETRERDTGSRTAADVVSDPTTEIRSPVTGTVKRAGSYVLYCDNSDDFVVIEPDSHPGWEVKVLHIDGVAVRPGARVEAARTVLAPRPTKLPFSSQVDEVSATPAWPHVHIEVVDPSIRDRPTPGGGCN